MWSTSNSHCVQVTLSYCIALEDFEYCTHIWILHEAFCHYMFLLDWKNYFEFIDIHKILPSLFHRRWKVIGLEQQYIKQNIKYFHFSWTKKPWFLRLCGRSSEVRVTVWQEVTLWSFKRWTRPLSKTPDPALHQRGDWNRPFAHNSHSMCALSREKAHTQSISRGLYLPGCPLWIFYLNNLGMSFS